MTRALSFGVLLSFVTASLAAVSNVEADLSTIAVQITSLSSAIAAFPTANGNLVSALDIHDQATVLASSLAAAATDVANTPGPIDQTDAQNIINQVQGFEGAILGALSGIVAKENGFATLPIGGIPALIAQDLATLKTDTKNFENALIADTPADLLSVATPITSTIDAALASASAVYATAAA